jgi:ABC-type multidrug transport system ATPase subunit
MPGQGLDAVIVVEGLSERFGNVEAVAALDFQVARGTTTPLLGANGAGRTTTISMLLRLLLPTRGRITILGEDMLRHRYRVLPRTNFTSPYADLPHRITVRKNLIVFGRLYGVHPVKRRVARVAAALLAAILVAAGRAKSVRNYERGRVHRALSTTRRVRSVVARRGTGRTDGTSPLAIPCEKSTISCTSLHVLDRSASLPTWAA